jgi:hypothetical protein
MPTGTMQGLLRQQERRHIQRLGICHPERGRKVLLQWGSSSIRCIASTIWTTASRSSTIEFTMVDLNGGEIRNCSDKQAMSQYKTAGGRDVVASGTIEQPFNGQWFQLNVHDAKITY